MDNERIEKDVFEGAAEIVEGGKEHGRVLKQAIEERKEGRIMNYEVAGLDIDNL